MKTDRAGFYTTMNAAERPTTAECRWTTSLLAWLLLSFLSK